jgi:hypothetical protein
MPDQFARLVLLGKLIPRTVDPKFITTWAKDNFTEQLLALQCLIFASQPRTQQKLLRVGQNRMSNPLLLKIKVKPAC